LICVCYVGLYPLLKILTYYFYRWNNGTNNIPGQSFSWSHIQSLATDDWYLIPLHYRVTGETDSVSLVDLIHVTISTVARNCFPIMYPMTCSFQRISNYKFNVINASHGTGADSLDDAN
jgi:hypothetical protein